jgi:hypothetical protein
MIDNATLISFAGFLDENMPPVLNSGVPEGVEWVYSGRKDSDLEFWWDLPIGMAYDDETKQDELVYGMKVKLTPSTMNCFMYHPKQSRPRQSISVPVLWPSGPEEFQEGLVKFLEALDGVISIFENSAFKTKLKDTIKSVPLSSVFGAFKNREQEPAAEPETPGPKKPDLAAAIASKDEDAILAAARGKYRVKADQIIDIYNVAKELRSNKLMNLVKSLQAESRRVDRFVNALLDDQKIPGGKGAKLTPKDVCPEELAMGIKVELEHSNNDRQLAQEIALDHLAEDPKYYSKGKSKGMFPELGEK